MRSFTHSPSSYPNDPMQNPLTHNHLLSMAAPPIIWAVHFVTCYVLVSLACAFRFGSGVTLSGIAGLTLVALALLVYTGLANYRKLQRAQRANSHMNAFFALHAVLHSLIAAIALAWVAFPAW